MAPGNSCLSHDTKRDPEVVGRVNLPEVDSVFLGVRDGVLRQGTRSCVRTVLPVLRTHPGRGPSSVPTGGPERRVGICATGTQSGEWVPT